VDYLFIKAERKMDVVDLAKDVVVSIAEIPVHGNADAVKAAAVQAELAITYSIFRTFDFDEGSFQTG